MVRADRRAEKLGSQELRRLYRATAEVLHDALKAGGYGGIVAVDREGRALARHRTRDMPHAFFSGEGPVVAHARV